MSWKMFPRLNAELTCFLADDGSFDAKDNMVGVTPMQHQDGTPGVLLHLDTPEFPESKYPHTCWESHYAPLTPDQARALGHALVQCADKVDP